MDGVGAQATVGNGSESGNAARRLARNLFGGTLYARSAYLAHKESSRDGRWVGERERKRANATQ